MYNFMYSNNYLLVIFIVYSIISSVTIVACNIIQLYEQRVILTIYIYIIIFKNVKNVKKEKYKKDEMILTQRQMCQVRSGCGRLKFYR